MCEYSYECLNYESPNIIKKCVNKSLKSFLLIKVLFENQQFIHGLSLLKKERTTKVHQTKNRNK